MVMNNFKARDLLGKKIYWEITTDVNRGYFRSNEGHVLDARGRNINIDGNWLWLPTLENVRIIEE